jgi:hypothetical protein
MAAEHRFLSEASLICLLFVLLLFEREKGNYRSARMLNLSRTAFANEDARTLFPQPLGKADTGPFHQHRPSHSLVPLRR